MEGGRSALEPASSAFFIGAAEVAAMARRLGLTAAELLPTLVPTAQSLARPPISHFPVGAAGLGSTGAIFLGANLEFPGAPLNQSVHAEQFLVSNAAGHGETTITHVAVSAVPCGHCRQFLQELRRASDILVLITSDGPDAAYRPLSRLLPQPFGPRDLLLEDSPLLMEPRDNALVIVRPGEEDSLLSSKALAAAKEAYAPYSGCPSGFAVVDGEGRVYAGSYAESAAYNPSLGPVQAALVAYVARQGVGGEGYESIVGAALVEMEEAAVSQEWTARMLMAVVAPRCRLVVYRCRRSS
ncbi:cytidine deaminase 1-like [Wolffia australiana]